LDAGMLDFLISSTESLDSLPPIFNYIYCLKIISSLPPIGSAGFSQPALGSSRQLAFNISPQNQTAAKDVVF
jgi:hypothetical protein